MPAGDSVLPTRSVACAGGPRDRRRVVTECTTTCPAGCRRVHVAEPPDCAGHDQVARLVHAHQETPLVEAPLGPGVWNRGAGSRRSAPSRSSSQVLRSAPSTSARRNGVRTARCPGTSAPNAEWNVVQKRGCTYNGPLSEQKHSFAQPGYYVPGKPCPRSRKAPSTLRSRRCRTAHVDRSRTWCRRRRPARGSTRTTGRATGRL